MKLLVCLKIGEIKGIKTVSETIADIRVNCQDIFPYPEMDKEMEEIYIDMHNYNVPWELNPTEAIKYIRRKKQNKERLYEPER